jgi:hypothetical protein
MGNQLDDYYNGTELNLMYCVDPLRVVLFSSCFYFPSGMASEMHLVHFLSGFNFLMVNKLIIR